MLYIEEANRIDQLFENYQNLEVYLYPTGTLFLVLVQDVLSDIIRSFTQFNKTNVRILI
jgi:hypothetical protein